MQIEPSLIEAEVYFSDPIKDMYFVKVSFIGTGMFINSFSVMPSKYDGNEYWLQAPKHRQGTRYVPTVDFAKGYPLWKIVETKAFEAVKQFKSDRSPIPNSSRDIVLTDISDEPIDLSELPF